MAQEGASLAARFGRLPLTGQVLLAGGVVMLEALHDDESARGGARHPAATVG